jgi:hypothetical protein
VNNSRSAKKERDISDKMQERNDQLGRPYEINVTRNATLRQVYSEGIEARLFPRHTSHIGNYSEQNYHVFKFYWAI